MAIPWKADVFRGAPQDKNSASFGTLGVNIRGRKQPRTPEILSRSATTIAIGA